MLRVAFLAGVFLLLFFADAERWSAPLEMSSKGVGFLGKFCFDSQHEKNRDLPVGEIEFTLETKVNSTAMGQTYIMLYDDQTENWPYVYENRDHMTCDEIMAKANNYNPKHPGQIANWQIHWEYDKGTYWFNRGETWRRPIHQVMRPRWWFITVINCAGALKDTTYTMHTWQSQSSHWDKEFGVNDQGLNTLNLVFFFYYFIFLVIHTIGTRRLGQQLEYTHPLVRLFYIIVVLQFLVVVARMLHYGIFAQNGWGVPELAKFAQVTEIFVRVGFLVILMLLAKGWTINPGEITGRKWILLFSFLFLFAEVAILFWKYAVEDPAATSPEFGLAFMLYTLMGFWFVWSLWFAKVIYSSWRHEENPVKKSLFFKLAIVYFPWFFGLPFITFLKFALDPWVREKTVQSISLLISTAAYTFLAWLLWPSRAEEYFSISASDTMTSGVDNYEQL